MRTIRLSEIAREANVDPRIARRRLREKKREGVNVPERLHDYNWVFPLRARRRVVRLISR